MKILALETSAKSVSVAVTEDGVLLAQSYQNRGLTHSVTLMPLLDAMLQSAGLTLDDIGLVAVTHGPGSFTGLRIGVSAAKGLAWAKGLPCCGVLWGFSFIIPGMTSSSILMAVGLLTPLIDGIAQLDFTVLVPWGLGMVGVMALFARIVSRLFDTHYSIAYHAVIGIVLASTLIIIPTDFASTAEMVWGVACAILGAVLAYFGSKLQPQEDAEIEAK